MPRCGQCGKVNREGALFCQDCGLRLASLEDVPKTRVAGQGERAASAPAVSASAAALADPPAPAPAAPAPLVCGSCGVANPPGMSFCKMCGTRIPAGAPAAAPAGPVSAPPAPGGAAASGSARIPCPSCAGLTPAGFMFCQHCGARTTAPPPRTATQEEVAPTVAVTPTPPAGLRRPAAVVPTPGQSSASGSLPRVPSPVGGKIQSGQIGSGGAGVGLGGSAALGVGTAPARPSALAGRARLVRVQADGTEGPTCGFDGEALDVGRTEGALRFEEDPCLAPRHARLERKGGTYLLHPLDSVNGVFVRLREPVDLENGDSFLVGRQLLRFEQSPPAEQRTQAAVEHGVQIYGSPLRPIWGRLRQISCAAVTLDVYHLARPEVVLGREEGHIRFPDDEHVSRRHAQLTADRGRVRLSDLGSSNGTFLRLRGARELLAGDLIRVGEQLLRFEA